MTNQKIVSEWKFWSKIPEPILISCIRVRVSSLTILVHSRYSVTSAQGVAWSNNKQRKKKCPTKHSINMTEKHSELLQPFCPSDICVSATEQLPRRVFPHVTWLLKKQECVEHSVRIRSHFRLHLGNIVNLYQGITRDHWDASRPIN